MNALMVVPDDLWDAIEPPTAQQHVPVEEAGMATTQGTHDVRVEARPHPLAIDPRQTAVLVVDMQNDFGAEGGMFAREGIDMSGIRAAVAPTARVLAAARQAGMPVVYLKMGFAADLSDAGGSEAPNRVRLDMIGQLVIAPDGSESRVLI